jgi:hypothetical protein
MTSSYFAAMLLQVGCTPIACVIILTLLEFNEHQRDMFCVFSGVGVQRLRAYLKANTASRRSQGSPTPTHFDADGTMFDDGEEPEMIVNVTAQANGMAIDEMEEGWDESEIMGQYKPYVGPLRTLTNHSVGADPNGGW